MNSSGRLLLLIMVLLVVSNAVWSSENKDLHTRYKGKAFYLQHNLRFQDDEASWVNFIAAGDYLPSGSPVIVEKATTKTVKLRFNNPTRTIKLDIEDAVPDPEVVLNRMLGAEPPSLDGMNEIDREGIKIGQVLVGMSRKAVFIAVGYPPYYYSPPFFFDKKAAVNHDPDAEHLTYMKSDFDFVTIAFSNGVVTSIED